MIQIIGGGELNRAFTELFIEAAKLYESKDDWLGVSYQVWELSDEEYQKLKDIEKNKWKPEYGWWRNNGCNHAGDELITFTINGENMIGFKNDASWYHSEDYLSELEEDEEPSVPSYASFSDWFSEYMSLSKPENLSYFATSLAEKNGLTKAEFFQKYEG